MLRQLRSLRHAPRATMLLRRHFAAAAFRFLLFSPADIFAADVY